ncbi:MAG: hypothetical protein K2X45_10575 [Phreatobacter sp.]|nr:hypothetical protein [Phreatobacter sp.]
MVLVIVQVLGNQVSILRRLFIAPEGVQVVVATRGTAGLEDAQPAEEHASDAAWSSRDNQADRGRWTAAAEVAAGFGISKRTARKWLSRGRSDRAAGLGSRSSRPSAVGSGPGRIWADLTVPVRIRLSFELRPVRLIFRFKGTRRSTPDA